MIRCNIIKHIIDLENPNVKADVTKCLNPEITDYLSSTIIELIESKETKEETKETKETI
jgi:hypothetical protein